MNKLEQKSRLKFAELTSSVGAGVLGVGIGGYFSQYIESLSVLIIIVGILTHTFGMFDKHRIEKEVSVYQPAWIKLLYWGCWAGIVLLTVYLIFHQRGNL